MYMLYYRLMVLNIGSLPQFHLRLRHLELRPLITSNDLLLLSSLHMYPRMPLDQSESLEAANHSYQIYRTSQANSVELRDPYDQRFHRDVDAPQLRSLSLS